MTAPGFVLHYLRIEWLEPGVARHVDVSLDPIELMRDNDGTYLAKTEMFRDFSPWVGLCFTNENTKVTPASVAGDGEERRWLKILDGQQRSWWVSDSGWDSQRNVHLSEMHRSLGRFEIAVGGTRLHLTNVALDLGRAEAEDYLAGFHDELIMLALGRGASTGQVARSETADLVEALASFATASRRILGRPALELTETEQLQTVDKLRPSAQTFREILRRPGERKYPGRGAVEDIDLPDNRFVHYMVQHCAKLAAQIGRSATAQSAHLRSRAERADTQALDLESTDREQVSPEVFERQLADIRSAIDAIDGWHSEDAILGDVRQFRVGIGGPYDGYPHTHFYVRHSVDPTDDLERSIKWSIVRMPQEVHQRVQAAKKVFDRKDEITFSAVATVGRNPLHQEMRLLHLKHVQRMTAHSLSAQRKADRRAYYERNRWWRKLTAAERRERSLEAAGLRARAKMFSARSTSAREAGAVLSSVGSDLTMQSAAWRSHGVGLRSEMPQGMRFIQSPPYLTALAAFKRVLKVSRLTGVGGDVLERLERVTILHASALYERWCLVKLVSLLVDEFRFVPEPDWIDSVIAGICGPQGSFALCLKREDLDMVARLQVQPVLENGRRPDFRLSFSKRAMGDRAAPAIILDAKFRMRWRSGEMYDVLDDLVRLRSYGEAARRVFILQPAGGAVEASRSPLSWGRDCDYGQDSPCGHKQGSIRLSSDEATMQNLQRLVAMELQASFPKPIQRTDGEWESQSFCIACGCRHEKSDVTRSKTGGGHDTWRLECHECGFVTQRTHCFECRAPLFKNGLQLTYHRTIADQVANVVCPSCGAFFDEDIHGTRN